jgi:hypothetical protein
MVRATFRILSKFHERGVGSVLAGTAVLAGVAALARVAAQRRLQS